MIENLPDPPNPQKAGDISEGENRRYEGGWQEGGITRTGIQAPESLPTQRIYSSLRVEFDNE